MNDGTRDEDDNGSEQDGKPERGKGDHKTSRVVSEESVRREAIARRRGGQGQRETSGQIGEEGFAATFCDEVQVAGIDERAKMLDAVTIGEDVTTRCV